MAEQGLRHRLDQQYLYLVHYLTAVLDNRNHSTVDECYQNRHSYHYRNLGNVVPEASSAVTEGTEAVVVVDTALVEVQRMLVE